MFRFLNFHRHPEIKGEWVFYFREPEVAAYFEQLITEEDIPYKKLKDEQKPDILYYSFTKEHFDRAQILNSEAMGKFPRPFIPEKSARVFLMVVFLLVFAFALTGYIVTLLKK
ncbi:MAG: hypothetical protein MH137_10870 [Flavobacteriales bacterium]|nr:hypothetical protein [Flavobacteriales bacterium]